MAADKDRRIDLEGKVGLSAYASSPVQKPCLRLFLAQSKPVAEMLPQFHWLIWFVGIQLLEQKIKRVVILELRKSIYGVNTYTTNTRALMS